MSGVRIPPGATQFTRTPRSTYSTASARVRLTTPPFDAQYAALYGWPMIPAFEAMFDDRAAAVEQVRERVAAHQERAGEVDADDRRPAGRVLLLAAGEPADAGGVHEQLRATEVAGDRGDRGLDGGRRR